MSRIGKHPIVIPAGVTVEVKDGIITVKGKNGQLTQEFSDVTVTVEDGQVQVDRSSDHKDQRAKHGLYRSLINNMVVGVTEGFTKSLELVELVIELQSRTKDLALGYSHNIVLMVASEVTLETISEKVKPNC
jgi:large subunit ribosomal protein L6